MKLSINRVILAGAIGRDGVEIRYNERGTAHASFMLVLTDVGQDGREHATWIPCNLITDLKDGAFHTTPNQAGACTQPGYTGSSACLHCQRSHGMPDEGALAPTNSVPSLMYPVQGRNGCCPSEGTTFFPPRPERRGFSKGTGEVWGKGAESAGELDAGQCVCFEGKLRRQKRGEQWETTVSGFEVNPVGLNPARVASSG